jgi:hypothetical protein
MKAQAVAEPAVQRATILKLTVFQTWCGCIVGAIAVTTAITAIANGWMGLPARVQAIQDAQMKLEEAQKPLSLPIMTLTNRVTALEEGQRLTWQKLQTDHDLLIGINQKLQDMDDRTRETAADVKALRK